MWSVDKCGVSSKWMELHTSSDECPCYVRYVEFLIENFSQKLPFKKYIKEENLSTEYGCFWFSKTILDLESIMPSPRMDFEKEGILIRIEWDSKILN